MPSVQSDKTGLGGTSWSHLETGLVSFENIPTTASAHRSLNTVKGVISENDFLSLSEGGVLEGLSEKNVVSVHRIKSERKTEAHSPYNCGLSVDVERF